MECQNRTETDFRILGLHTKIDRNTKLSKQWKILAGVCLFFSICYCLGTKRIGNIDKGQALLTEDLNDKKEIAKITGEILSDNVLNKQIDMPNEKVSLPIIYYSILLGMCEIFVGGKINN